MIEERGRVVAVEPGAVWVETVRSTACQSCAARKGCGHAMLDGERAGARANVRALADQSLQVGDQVVLGVPEGLLMRGAVMVYLLPLLLLLGGALIGASLDLKQVDGSAIGGVAGLLVGFLLNRWYSVRHQRDPAMHPRVLRTECPDIATS
ncbi:MAG: alginate biosynthesis protein AlgM [Gammaproteobacteria bacterium HGW-Gammaproteobacteria-14]|nr:MAG: alginate biosynthesis protein AlgM [Gammaproteobacteria bacterium HGW-Gammaproteobacteria-14]